MFELKRKTAHGSFSLKLSEDPTAERMQEICKLAFNLTEEPKTNNDSDNGPPTFDLTDKIAQLIRSEKTNTLGKKPVEEISLGTYTEPENGVYIQMLDLPRHNMPTAVKELQLVAPISLTGWVNILRGNFFRVKFTPEIAAKVMSIFKRYEIYAKLVNANEESHELKSQAISTG